MSESIRSLLDRTYRREYGQILATLLGWLGDFELAEDSIQDAFLAAGERWEREGAPTKPGAWLTTAARRKAIDRIRRFNPGAVDPQVLEILGATGNQGDAEMDPRGSMEDPFAEDAFPDERLKLIFICCHPALAPEQQVAFTLYTLGGLTTAEIAAAFLVPVPTMAQRLVRAKQKIKISGIPYYVPPPHLIAERVDSVLAVLYLIFTEGYAATADDALIRHELCDDAIHLCRLMELLIRRNGAEIDLPLPQKSEILGLLGLMLLNNSRRNARVDGDGKLILLGEQDRSLWDRRNIEDGLALLDAAFHMRQVGPYLLQAAISAVHARALTPEATDWPRIVALYGELLKFTDTAVIRLNQAVAVSLARSPTEGLRLLEPLKDELGAYAPFYLAQADMFRRGGNIDRAGEAYRFALDLTQNEIERDFLRGRLKTMCALPPQLDE